MTLHPVAPDSANCMSCNNPKVSLLHITFQLYIPTTFIQSSVWNISCQVHCSAPFLNQMQVCWTCIRTSTQGSAPYTSSLTQCIWVQHDMVDFLGKLWAVNMTTPSAFHPHWSCLWATITSVRSSPPCSPWTHWPRRVLMTRRWKGTLRSSDTLTDLPVRLDMHNVWAHVAWECLLGQCAMYMCTDLTPLVPCACS